MSSAVPAGAFRVVALPGNLASHVPHDRVIKAEALAAEHRRQEDTRRARAEAAEILDDAHARADAVIRAATVEAERLHSARLERIESEVADQLDAVAAHLGDAVAASVESIYRCVFRSDPGLLVEATVGLARDVLREQVGAVLHLDIADRDDVRIQALRDRYSVQADSSLPNGVLLVRGEDGDIRIDAFRLIDELGQDLRRCFRRVGQTDNVDRGNP